MSESGRFSLTHQVIMTYFFGMDALTGAQRGPRTSRQRERLSHSLYRLCEAHNEVAMESMNGGSTGIQPAPRAPHMQRRAARKPASRDDGDSDGEPSRRRSPLFYDLRDVANVLTLSPSGIQAMVRAGEFPKPRELSPRRVAWLAEEVVEWARSRPLASMLPPDNAGARRTSA